MDGEKQNIQTSEKEWLLESILNDSNQMIQVSDLETYTMMYANEAARVYTGHAEQPYHGQHCYTYMMGLDAPCPFVPVTAANIILSDGFPQRLFHMTASARRVFSTST